MSTKLFRIRVKIPYEMINSGDWDAIDVKINNLFLNIDRKYDADTVCMVSGGHTIEKGQIYCAKFIDISFNHIKMNDKDANIFIQEFTRTLRKEFTNKVILCYALDYKQYHEFS